MNLEDILKKFDESHEIRSRWRVRIGDRTYRIEIRRNYSAWAIAPFNGSYISDDKKRSNCLTDREDEVQLLRELLLEILEK